MSQVFLLFKKDFAEKYSNLFRKNKSDIISYITTLLLMTVLYGTFIYVYYRFGKMYLNQIFDNPMNMELRLFELMTFTYSGIILLNILLGIRQIYKTMMSVKDMEVLIAQPISSKTIFIYKIVKIYLYQVFSTMIVLIPVAIVVSTTSNLDFDIGYAFTIAFQLLLIPMISCGIASMLSIIYNYVMDFIENKFILHLICYVVILGIGFYLYSIFLNLLSTLLQNGDIAYFFELRRILLINKMANNLFPANLLGNMIIKNNYLLNTIIIIGCSIVCLCIAAFFVGFIYHKILQNKLEGLNTSLKSLKAAYKEHSQMTSLIEKEFKVVLRTPNYAFQYFATTFTLPFMVYICVNLMKKMFLKIPLLSLISLDYEIALFVISMFMVITNTFCTTNMSRDGKMVYILKTLPLSGKTIVFSKIIFCIIVAEISIVLSVFVLLVTRYLTIIQALIIFIISSIVSVSEIMLATRRDLNNLSISETENSELDDENTGTSLIIFIGILISLVLGVVSTLIKVVIATLQSSVLAYIISTASLILLVSIVFLVSLRYLMKNINEKFHNFEG